MKVKGVLVVLIFLGVKIGCVVLLYVFKTKWPPFRRYLLWSKSEKFDSNFTCQIRCLLGAPLKSPTSTKLL